MIEIRLAREGEIDRQKDMWKLCFGDRETYIDFYFANEYKENETLALTYNKEIVSILTMIPMKTVLPDKRSLSSAMLYAIATHPDYRNRGYSTELITYAEKYLAGMQNHFTILVPAGQHLFDFYRKQGYREYFYLREALLSLAEIDILSAQVSCRCKVYPLDSKEYNLRRNELLHGSLYIAYTEDEIRYQQKLSRYSGADIYAIDLVDLSGGIGKKQGCAVIERRNTSRVVIKELLLPEDNYLPVLKELTRFIPSREYVVRTPAHLGQSLGGSVRPFGMIKSPAKNNLKMLPDMQGYLGIAFD